MSAPVIAVDFDGTIVEHRYPDVGAEAPGAIAALRELCEMGCRLVLFTMRSDGPDGPTLTDAVEFCRRRGVEFYGVNHNPDQDRWTSSPKAYAHVYIDDAALGCPLRDTGSGRKVVDWDEVMKIMRAKWPAATKDGE